MTNETDIIKALCRLGVETGSLVCLGCGHEHNCGIRGCAIICAATTEMASLRAQLAASQQETRAAVEDLHRLHTICMDIGGCCTECGSQIDDLMDAACNFCNGSGVGCFVADKKNADKCAAFDWRGPQEVRRC